MIKPRYLPDISQLSILAAVILLTYALTPYVSIPESGIALPVAGAVFTFRFGFVRLVSFLLAAMAAVGMEWLLRAHPSWGKHRSFQHWFLPALTAWAIGFPLSAIAVGPGWWVVFGLGSLLLVFVLVAEYVVYDFSDIYSPLAIVGLTAVSFALYLYLAIALRAEGVRLYVLLPLLIPTVALASVRAIFLRLSGVWKIDWGIAVAVVVSQLAIGLQYLPVLPLTYGLLLLGAAYSLTSAACLLEEGKTARRVVFEALISWMFFAALGLLFQFLAK
ncbi:MAG: hypothetical protein HPY45_08055 [Anaerolineae bacterium]|nr:hypothetical protein [Anaerolineae bacterium]